ncbi:PREDICTED: odorant receptor 82a-like [Trachymyrmex cornetzi]|uniref:odorant receptor 82a-like n=1 Tax=Trachymyrmex cornetzi TaxID=471704 RepID=UPI00084F0F87|nr:PREDICTED: odorant receptor 82a-like [Trachymyrmex cornetzi]
MTNLKRDLRNVDFNHINNYSLQINRWCLKPIGAWPITSTSSTLEKIAAIVLNIFCSLTIAIVLVPCILYVILEDQTIMAKIDTFGPLFHRIMGSISYWTLLKRSHDIHNCIQHMEMDWQLIQRIGDRETMLQYAKFGRFIAGISAAVTQGGQLLYGTAKAIKTTTIVVGNETFKMHPMTCPTYSKILDTRFSPINEIMLTIQFVSACAVGSAIVSVCSLAGVFAMHACGQLNVLYAWLNELVIDYEEKGNQSVEQKLAAIVEHHLRALSFIARVESIMHKVCLVILMGCTLNMCLLGYYFIMNWGTFDATKILSFITLYTSMGFNIFIFCYIGEILTEQCKNVGDMVYMINWYQLPRRTALCLILIIMRSSNVIKITAGKLINLSIATFGDVIKTSLAYLNILRTIM